MRSKNRNLRPRNFNVALDSRFRGNDRTYVWICHSRLDRESRAAALPPNLWLLLACLLVAVLAGSSLSAAETDELLPSKRYLTAFESMSAADRLQERGMKEDAAALYGEAFKLFQQLASDYPMWQTNLVAFRVNYCQEELNKTLKSGQRSGEAAVLSAGAGETKDVDGKIREAAGLERAGDFKDALELYKAVLAQDKQHLAALAGAGRCFLRFGRVDAARDLLFQWCVVPSSDNSINALLALILCHDRQFERAIQIAEIALREDNSNAGAHVILGAALAGTGQTGAAIAEMQQALALNPRLAEAHYNLACLILKKEPGKKTTAGEYYLNALKFGARPDPALAKLLKK